MRTQIYGGLEQDSVMSGSARAEQHYIGNEIAEGVWEKAMRQAAEFGPGYGHRTVAQIFEDMVSEAVAAGVSPELARNRAYMTLSRATYGVPVEGKGKRRRW